MGGLLRGSKAGALLSQIATLCLCVYLYLAPSASGLQVDFVIDTSAWSANDFFGLDESGNGGGLPSTAKNGVLLVILDKLGNLRERREDAKDKE